MNQECKENLWAELHPLVIVPPPTLEHYFPILRSGQTVAMKSGLVTLEAGQSVGEHSTERHEEQLIILNGKGIVTAEGMDKREVSAGQFAYIPPHTRHNVTAASDCGIRYVYVVCRVEFEPTLWDGGFRHAVSRT